MFKRKREFYKKYLPELFHSKKIYRFEKDLEKELNEREKCGMSELK